METPVVAQPASTSRRGNNAWIQHVRSEASSKGVSFAAGLTDKAIRESYYSKKSQ